MKRKYIHFSIQGQIIQRTDELDIVSGSQNYLYAKFSMSEDWDDLAQTAVFSTSSGKQIGTLIRNGECEIPWEVLRGNEFWVGVFAGERITSNTVRVPLKTGVKANTVAGAAPTPTLYEQVLAIADGLEKKAERGEFDGFSPTAEVTEIPGGIRSRSQMKTVRAALSCATAFRRNMTKRPGRCISKVVKAVTAPVVDIPLILR